ncbi:MAG: site-2 protease family protein [candidate division Zixibacteria bacterium]|nr:site-2 protease family protein [candidate division Zixibacteria bacterium]
MALNRQEVHEKTLQVRRLLEDLFILEAIYSTRSSVVLRGAPLVPANDFAAAASARLTAAGYRSTVETGLNPGQVGPRALVTVHWEEQTETVPWINVALFLATVGSTTLLGGPKFAVWFLAILLFHEFGHFILARKWKIDASWPYFIPAPTILGTFGAFIRLRSPIRDRVALFDMAVAGPLAGFVIAVTALIVGLAHSTIVGPEAHADKLMLGESLLFRGLASLILPGLGPDQDVILHPIAFAGWAGLLVTMFNLLQIGQLDGGHIAYALFGRGQRWLGIAAIAALATISFWWPWWLIWVGIGLLMRPQHPPTMIDEIPIGRGRRILGWLAFVIFALCFTPAPFSD